MNLSNNLKIYFLKYISRRKICPLILSSTPKLLVLMNQKIGDMIVCSPILREIKLAYPKSELHVLASEVNKELLLSSPYVDKVHVYKNQWQKLLPLLLTLRKLNFDVAVELEFKVVSRIIILLRIVNPNCILSVSKSEGRYGMDPHAVMPYDYYTNPNLVHQRDTCLDILRLLNINYKNKSYDVFYSEKNKLDALSFLSLYKTSKILIGLNIRGSSIDSRISNKDVTKIILELYSMDNNISIILLHKPDDRDWISKLIPYEASSYVFPSYPTESVLDLAAIIDNLDLIISTDTSIVHMACAFKKPLVAIYRKHMMNFEIWHPISDCNYVVFSDYEDSLKSINVGDIVNKTSRLIKEFKL
jgi:ADP-heptose:LPS heptosyltransferase